MTMEEILYCIGMESPTGWAYMEQLCKATGVKYPPRSLKEIVEERKKVEQGEPVTV